MKKKIALKPTVAVLQLNKQRYPSQTIDLKIFLKDKHPRVQVVTALPADVGDQSANPHLKFRA